MACPAKLVLGLVDFWLELSLVTDEPPPSRPSEVCGRAPIIMPPPVLTAPGAIHGIRAASTFVENSVHPCQMVGATSRSNFSTQEE